MDFLIHHMLRGSALRAPQKEALVHGSERLSYHEVWEQTSGLACGLRTAGLPPRDRGVEKALAALIYPSGSTGRPKGVMLSHAQVMAGSSIVSTYLEITSADRILAV